MEISSLCVCVNVGAVIFFQEGKKVFSCVEKICVREPLLLAFRRHKREENERRKEREREREKGRAPLSLCRRALHRVWRCSALQKLELPAHAPSS